MVPQVTDTMRESQAYWAVGEEREFQVFVPFPRHSTVSVAQRQPSPLFTYAEENLGGHFNS